MGTHAKGFSLVELSIVLVILGLLVGGILGGQSLIRAAELRNITTEYEQWQTALNSFQMQYNALPGDMPNATRFWGRVPDGLPEQCATPNTATGSGTQTCNGNGDGEVQGSASHERYRFWQHLANAGLISGQYTGVAGPNGAQEHIIGENTPASRVSGLGWSLENNGANVYGNGNSASQYFWNQQGALHHVLGLGTASLHNDTVHGFSSFTPAEIWSVDMKLDDGKPGTGRVHTVFRGANICTTGTSTSDFLAAEYNLGLEERQCNILFPRSL